MARRKTRRAGLGVLTTTILVLGTLPLGYAQLRRFVHTPLDLEAPASVTVKRGSSLKPTLAELERQGVLRHVSWVYLYARLHGRTTIRAGEYAVLPGDTPRTLLDKLAEGKVKTEQFAVIEGHNRWLVRDALVAARWMSAGDFDRLCDDPAFLARHGVPGPSCEGYLFPDTYTFARGLAPEAILGTMFAMFHKAYEEVTAKGRGPLDLEMRELATLASIIEKETGAAEERPRIACVFYNRLRAKPRWRLETDPTVIYAATLADPAFDGNIKHEHLRQLDHPYNTYRVFGLPPGPIASAGRAALRAAVEPAPCEDFFFVSKNNGEHVFCPTLACHNQAVETWQVQYFRKRKQAHRR